MNEDKIIEKIIKLEEDVTLIKETMATKDDIRQLLDGQDKMINTLQRVDQEYVFTNHRVGRLRMK